MRYDSEDRTDDHRECELGRGIPRTLGGAYGLLWFSSLRNIDLYGLNGSAKGNDDYSIYLQL